MNIGIVGNGFVGGATSLFETRSSPYDINVIIYDKDTKKRSPINVRLEDFLSCDLVFVCVPTPMNDDGSCHVSIVNDCVLDLVKVGVNNSNIIVRSTVPVGFCESLGVSFMPEFLTEKNWKNDYKNNNLWIFGLYDKNDEKLKLKIRGLIGIAHKESKIDHNNISFCSSGEAEMVKLARNAFLATKVSFFNEVYDFCQLKNLDFGIVSDLVGVDVRIGKSHTIVPGPDGKRGFGGTCLPKDLSSLYYQMNEAGMESFIVEAVLARNTHVDRKDRDWALDKGRAVV